MINRISGVGALSDPRRPAARFYVPDRNGRRSGWEQFRERVGKSIGDHPVASLAIGLAVGIAIGCLMKRR